MLGWIWTLVIGLIVGALAKLVIPGKDPGGCIITALLGVAGAMLAGFLGQMAGLYAANEPAGFIGAFVGAVLILLVYRMIKRK